MSGVTSFAWHWTPDRRTLAPVITGSVTDDEPRTVGSAVGVEG
jgi:hypothetical protein